MENTDETKPNFIKHVFKLDDEGKSDMLNIIQYALIAIIPVVVLNKGMQKFIPEADEDKGNVEILAEILIQVIVIFIGLLLIHRTVTFIPTYSGVKYPDFNIIFIILSVLMITLSLQTKLGEKVSILVERITDLWEGTSNASAAPASKKNKKMNNVKVSQPISGNTQQSAQQQPSSQTYSDSTSINSLPVSQPLPDYNNMYVKDTTPMVGASTPGQQSAQENYTDYGGVVPASEFGGFGGFSSW